MFAHVEFADHKRLTEPIWLPCLPNLGDRIDLNGDDFEVVAVMWNFDDMVPGPEAGQSIPSFAPMIRLK